MEDSDIKYYAVLTGDIVKSQKLSADKLKDIRKRLRDSLRDFDRHSLDSVIKGEIDFYRGDGWQLVINQPWMFFRIAVYVRAALIGFEEADTRVSVGIGSVENFVRKEISLSTGEAFKLSGQTLDALKKRQRFGLSMEEGFSQNYNCLPSTFGICDALLQQWSKRQAEAVFFALRQLSSAEIGSTMKPTIKRATVTQYLNDAGWFAISCALERLERKVVK